MQVRWKILLLASVIALCFAKKKVPQVEIITEHKPEYCPDTAQPGDTVSVHYVGALENGQVFDTSKQEGRQPFELTLGKGTVIKGWEEGLIGICQGEVRKLIIPSHLGYGDRGMPPHIPGKATLIFSIECLKLTKNSVFNITDEQKQLLFYVGIFIIGILVVYELYQRVNKEEKESKKKGKVAHPNKKGSKKGKKS
ncbi:peptidyl-prolyl cis-trans isomerase FKBP2-like [Dysidea avara]|uniref:peptidyl-prolyl cis-trans isomerase FKBP2-like n=1 Tax=Dysidea avara TaxID=196820 RepID=UPI00332B33A8